MAPERPRSMGYDIPFGPRIIERKPESEFRDFFRPVKIERVQPRPILRRVEPVSFEPDFVQSREPRRHGSPPIRHHRPPPDEFVPLPPPVPSPRCQPEEDAPILELRSPRSPRSPRRPPIIHSPSPRLREHRRSQGPSPPPSPVREIETIRVRKLDRTDRSKAERRRVREVEDEARIERERRHDVEDNNRYLTEIALRERAERRRAERAAQDAAAQRRSAEVAADHLQRENDRLDRERRFAERQAALQELQRERERDRVREALRRPEDAFRPAREVARQTREVARPAADRGTEVIQAAQEARRRERVFYHLNGRRIEQDRYD